MIEEIGKDVLKKAAPEIVKKFGGQVEKTYHSLKAKVANACHHYEKNYRERHGQIKNFCVGMRKPIPLDNVYIAIQFIDQDNTPKYRSLDDIENEFRVRNKKFFELDPIERQDGTKVANDNQFLMVLGGPGVGKSTFLRKVGLEALKGKKSDFDHKCIPIFLELKRFSENQINIKSLIVDEFRICGYPYPDQLAQTALESGKLLILLDGLDEVPTPNVDNVVGKIGDFVDQYSKNRFIATCRIAAYKGGFKRFSEVEIANFDDSQIELYINNWFASAPDKYRRQFDEEMKTAEQCWNSLNAPEHQPTKELAQNPLLLTLLCMVYDRTQDFPRNRSTLYEDALNIFLKEWNAEKRIRRSEDGSQYLDVEDEKRMLSDIAAKNFDSNKLFFRKHELIEHIKNFRNSNANTPPTFNAVDILNTILIDQGILVERSSDVYSFSHLTFQEYLTGKYIIGDTRSIQGLVTRHLHDERWREVFLLTSGLMRESDSLLECLENEAKKTINTKGLKQLLLWAKSITNTVDNSYSSVAKRAFVIRQYFSLWWVNKIYDTYDKITTESYKPEFTNNYDTERVVFLNNDLNRSRDLYKVIDYDLYKDLSLELKYEPNRAFGGDYNLYLELYIDPNLDFKMLVNTFRDIYKKHYPELFPELNLYQELTRYITSRRYPSFFLEKCNDIEHNLKDYIKIVERMSHMKIFNSVDLEPVIGKYNEHIDYIGAAKKRQQVNPPDDSKHKNWISILRITEDMLTMPIDELESLARYLRVVHLIVMCKEASGRVSPPVWKEIENQLIAQNAEEIEN